MPGSWKLAAVLVPTFVMTGCPTGGTIKTAEGQSVAECSDELDNDEDGAVDCADDGCWDYGICDTGDETETVTISGLYINEFMASNLSTITDENGGYADWIELFNSSGQDIDLGGLSITDDLNEPDQHVFEAGLVVPSGGFLLLWADGSVDSGLDHVDFKLSADGEELALFDPDGDPIDQISFGEQASDISAARVPDGSENWEYTEDPTPGDTNGGP